MGKRGREREDREREIERVGEREGEREWERGRERESEDRERSYIDETGHVALVGGDKELHSNELNDTDRLAQSRRPGH